MEPPSSLLQSDKRSSFYSPSILANTSPVAYTFSQLCGMQLAALYHVGVCYHSLGSEAQLLDKSRPTMCQQ